MLKVRLQGTTNDIKWFRKILERNRKIKLLSFSEPYANKGTKKYFRVYAEQWSESKAGRREESKG